MTQREEFEEWFENFAPDPDWIGNLEFALTAWEAAQVPLLAKIAALEAERDALRKSVEWVAVSEKEPPLGVTVLLAAEFDGPGDWRVKCGGLTRDRKWHVFGADWTPTYWKPLPTPPSIAIAAKEQKC